MDELLDNAPCGFLTLASSNEIVEINKTLLNLLGYKREEVDRQPVGTLLSAGGKIFYQTHFFPLLKLQNKLEEVYLSLRCKSGEEIPVLVNAALRERGGSTFYDFALMPMHNRNIYEDDILRAKNEAETANRTKEEFLSVVSHDLRTPLNSIIGWARILKNQENNTELVKKAFEVITRSAIAQQSLIEDILDFARISSGKLGIETGPINLTEIIESALEIVSFAADAKDIRLQHTLAPEIFILGDDTRLQQVLWNLLSNAIKFTPKNGQVNIRLKQVGAIIEIEVNDTGNGISADFLPYVFDRFQQGTESGTQKHSGLGLGLTITRHIVELHGGTICAKSPGEDQGATFIVSLPAIT
jgi:PAS domain S-box-containing protein